GDIVMKCLRRTPSERFASVNELAAALAPFAGEIPTLAPDAVVSRPRLTAPIESTVAVDRPPGTTLRAWNTLEDRPRPRVWPWAVVAMGAIAIGGATVL